MNRRGSLDWNLESVGKLLLGVAALLVIIYFVGRIIGIFAGGYEESTQRHTLGLLADRIEATYAQKLSGPEASVIVDYPSSYYLTAFSTQTTNLKSCVGGGVGAEDGAVFDVNRPSSCGSASCVCLVKRGPTIVCEPVGVSEIVFINARDSTHAPSCALRPDIESGKLIPVQSLKLQQTDNGVQVLFVEDISPDLLIAKSGREP